MVRLHPAAPTIPPGPPAARARARGLGAGASAVNRLSMGVPTIHIPNPRERTIHVLLELRIGRHLQLIIGEARSASLADGFLVRAWVQRVVEFLAPAARAGDRRSGRHRLLFR